MKRYAIFGLLACLTLLVASTSYAGLFGFDARNEIASRNKAEVNSRNKQDNDTNIKNSTIRSTDTKTSGSYNKYDNDSYKYDNDVSGSYNKYDNDVSTDSHAISDAYNDKSVKTDSHAVADSYNTSYSGDMSTGKITDSYNGDYDYSTGKVTDSYNGDRRTYTISGDVTKSIVGDFNQATVGTQFGGAVDVSGSGNTIGGATSVSNTFGDVSVTSPSE